eukprot:TRINITY_DN9054_c0_g2_i1.p1 TRINITY_DN9054_c0_g2~~TRINITY_DN9054_c0_g2_i1.p1  ORF type:complete len:121 (+),score=9.62 TRINITY_DN9054_c0_g2_i1:75-437(+)
MADQICYSAKYYDDTHEYRHVILPKKVAKLVPDDRLMTETEWRNIGVQQSRGWIHYMIHRPGTNTAIIVTCDDVCTQAFDSFALHLTIMFNFHVRCRAPYPFVQTQNLVIIDPLPFPRQF